MEATTTTKDKGRVLKKNALAVKNAKAIRGKRTTYRIEGERGLELRVQPSGAATWAFVYAKGPRDARVVKRVVLGHRDDTDVGEACAKASKMRAAVLDGDPVEDAKAAKAFAAQPVLTFKALAATWLERHAKPNKGERSVYDDQIILTKDALPAIGALPADKVTKSQVLQITNAVAERGTTGRLNRPLRVRPNRVLSLIRTIYRWGVSEDLIANDPTAGIKQRAKEVARDRVLTPDEIRGLWFGLEKTGMDKRTLTAIRLALVTAQRIGEVSCINKAELDLAPGKAVWTLPGKRSKNKETHRTPLSKMAVGLIEGAMETAGHSAYLFPVAPDKPIAASAASKSMFWVRPQLGIENVRIHDLRRTAASYMAEMEVSQHTISLVLNHVSAAKGTITGEVYVKYGFDREKRRALEMWARRLEKILAGKNAEDEETVVPMVRA